MKHFVPACLFALLLSSSVSYAGLFDDNPQPCISSSGTGFSTAFSTSGNVAPAVAQEINNAQKSVRVVTRRFASKPVSQALYAAMRAGRDVKILVDKGRNSDGYSAVGFLQTMGHPPHVLRGEGDLYMSYIVIDEKEVILGSVATLPDVDDEKKNPVGVLIIRNAPDLAKGYLANFDALWANSVEMKAK